MVSASDSQRLSKGTERIGKLRTSRDYPNNSIVKIYRITKKNPRNLRFSLTQTPERPSINAGVKKTPKQYDN